MLYLWVTMSGVLMKMFFDLRQDIEPKLNNTLIVLIPKVQNPKSFAQIRPISLCFVLYKMILWNGISTQKFKPTRGVRQGCLLSPYRFALCMEWLGYSIRTTINSSKWHPIQLSRSGLD
ncbi:Retrovirus-related Pol polyprotein LINE-1 [Gossypium australe]|uniref:Retrovirus-related Pol polyprotein LINE-1 n=1 Tax=Gossypium australe TaxID=47621 RepID=A0A5B6UYB7_9ROSI|nr:Retrovirus-related Pol polyprotein LINE-1 [Gossypium australe]